MFSSSKLFNLGSASIRLLKFELVNTLAPIKVAPPIRLYSTEKSSNKLVVVGLGNIGDQFDGTRHNIGFACVDAIAKEYKLAWHASPRMQALIAEGKIECVVEVKHRDNTKKKEDKEKKKKKQDKEGESTEKKDTEENKDEGEKAIEADELKAQEDKEMVPKALPPPTYMKVVKHLILVKPTTLMNRSGSAVAAVISHYKVPLSDLMVIMDDIDLDAGRVQLKRGGGCTQRGIEDVVRAVRTPAFLRARFGISNPPRGAADKSNFVLSKFSRGEASGVKEGIEKVREGVQVWMEKGEAHAMNVINKR